MGWDAYLIGYMVLGFIITELAMRLANKTGKVTPITHSGAVIFFAYILHFLFWPIFIILGLIQGMKGGKDNDKR